MFFSNVFQCDDVEESQAGEEETETKDSEQTNLSETKDSDQEKDGVSDDFTLVSRAKSFRDLLLKLESYFQDGQEHAQMIIQRQVDEM